ncbi:MAG: thermonuclease family protein [Candidatus Eremiobacteraeota bacterium]|nr:thermonuclease family protein [Candidatus Eremiobacteraeota bacterium]
MKKTAFLLPILFLFLVSVAVAQEYTGKVVSVIDSSNISVVSNRGEAVVRLSCVMSPVAGQPFAEEAQKFLKDLILDKTVEVSVSWMDHDSRQVSKLTIEGKNAGVLLAGAGMAWYDRRHGEDGAIAQAQAEAKSRGIGLWSEPDPVAPWEFLTARRGILPDRTGTPTGAKNSSYGFNILENKGDVGTSWEKSTILFSTSPYYGNWRSWGGYSRYGY